VSERRFFLHVASLHNIRDGILPEEEQLFVTTMNGNKIWLIEDGAAFTMMYPEDY